MTIHRPRTRALHLITSITLLPIILAACESGPKASTTPPSPESLYNDWTLATLAGNSVSELVPQGARLPSLSIARDGKVSGYTSINALGSSLDQTALTNGRFALGPIMTTRRAGAPQLMAVESLFVDSLRKADTYAVAGNTLTLSQGPEELMTMTGAAK